MKVTAGAVLAIHRNPAPVPIDHPIESTGTAHA
jgi:hypothetical protein